MSRPAARLIVTRPAAQARSWVQALQTLGVEAVALPLIEIAPLADPAPLHAAWARLPQLQLVMFVSAAAVSGFFAARPDGLSWPMDLRAAATGPGTASALRAAGVPATAIVLPAADATSLDSEALWARLEHEPWRGRAVLVVRGAVAVEAEPGEAEGPATLQAAGRDWFAQTLQTAGAEVSFVIAYERRAPRLDDAGAALLQQALARPQQHRWLFSSSEAIAHLQAMAAGADWSASRALASHPRIADAARRVGFGEVAHHLLPSPEALATLLRADPAPHASPGGSADPAR